MKVVDSVQENNTLSQMPVRRIFSLIGAIALSEILIMTILDFIPRQNDVIRGLVDTILLLILLTPLLYFGFLRPMERIIDNSRRMQMALAEREAHFRLLTQSADALIWMVEPDKRCSYVNQTYIDFTGRPLEEQLGDGWIEDLHPEDRQFCIDTFYTAFDKRERYSMKYRFIHHSGNYRWVQANGSPSYNHKGEFIGYVGHCMDIHEHVQAEENIKKREKDYRTLFEYSPIPAIFWNLQGTILFWNQAAERTFGYSKEEVEGKDITQYFKPDFRRPEINFNIEAALYEVGNKPVVKEFLRRDGRIIICEWNRTPIYGLDGKIMKIISVAKDITERVQFEQELIAAKEKAEESERLKSAFLANMSHELRSPLNSIIGFSELLSDTDFDADQKLQFAQLINKGGKNLLETITELMDFSKIEAGQVKINKKPILLHTLLSELHLEYAYKADAKGIALTLDINHDNHELIIESDEVKLRQILVNLLSNALKFTASGSIEIGLRTTESLAQFHVKDTGIGIPQEYRDKIFERFLQVESYNKRKFGGIGLGLAISKSLVELMGGDIWVESSEGMGSTFYFNLPRREEV